MSLLVGDCRDVLPTLAAGSVHCVVTSPPYWGLRDYGTASWDGGDPECRHKPDAETLERQNVRASTLDGGKETQRNAGWSRHRCKCGARRIDRQLGLEPTPEEYVVNMVAVFREVRRVLRDDGTVWLNLGDSYAQGGSERPGSSDAAAFRPHDQIRRRPGIAKPRVSTLKPKDLVGIPWRVAFALQADGWYLRSDIIWSKPNPMPESVTDRPTKSHEYLFLLSKKPTYYFDADAVREPHDDKARPNGPDGLPTFRGSDGVSRGEYQPATQGWATAGPGGLINGPRQYNPAGRNIRSVWTIATQPYPGAHFATFPEALVAPCIKAGTSERGVCSECGAPWERVVERERTDSRPGIDVKMRTITGGNAAMTGRAGDYDRETTGWRPSCAHDAPTVPATVLDPFSGSGTVGRVAERLSRRSILIELNPAYVELAEERTAQVGLGLSA